MTAVSSGAETSSPNAFRRPASILCHCACNLSSSCSLDSLVSGAKSADSKNRLEMKLVSVLNRRLLKDSPSDQWAAIQHVWRPAGSKTQSSTIGFNLGLPCSYDPLQQGESKQMSTLVSVSSKIRI